MADQGFTIEDMLTPLCMQLNIPPFLAKSEQFAATEAVNTQQIASLRIHVERAISHVKKCDILANIMPASLASSANQICCLLTYFENPSIL